MESNNKKQLSILDEKQKQSIKEYFGIDLDSELFSPIVDYAFKRLFTADEKRSKIALMDFLNSVLEYEPGNQIVDLTVINPQIPVDVIERKKAVFDIRVRYNNGEQAIMEMQMNNEGDFKKRSQFIVSSAYTSQPISGQDFNALKKCFLICITNFVLFKEHKTFLNDYRFRDKVGKDLSDDETIVFMELPKIDEILNKPVQDMTNIEMWAVFFRHVTDKNKRTILQEIIHRKEGIKMAANILNEISKDEQERIQYQNELIYELDVNTKIANAEKRGKAEGLIEGKIIIAKKLLTLNTPLEQVQDITELPIEKIEEIQNNQ